MLDEDELERKIKDLKGKNWSNKPESRKAKKFLIEQMIARGFKREELADRIGISVKTVYNLLKAPTDFCSKQFSAR